MNVAKQVDQAQVEDRLWIFGNYKDKFMEEIILKTNLSVIKEKVKEML